jgi:phage terminase large subunit-like protein
VAGRPAKTLAGHVREGTFRAHRHGDLLLGPDLSWAGFALLQQRYRALTREPERQAIAREFEHAVNLSQDHFQQELAAGNGRSLDDELATLGQPGTVSHLARFFEHYFVHPKGPSIGKPFRYEPWQKRFATEFFRRDKHGRRLYRLCVLGLPRGNGKTPLAAGLGLYELVTRTDAPEVYCAACSKDQARIALDFARAFVEQGPLADWVTAKSSLSCPARQGTMRVVSSEGKLQFGRAPAAAIIDELWAVENTRQEGTYHAFASALHKRDDALLLAITTAGYDKQTLLGRIYEEALTWPHLTVSADGCLTIAKDEANGSLLWWYGAPEDADLENTKIWRAANPASWIKLRDLKRQLHDPGLGELEFRRLNLNQWTRSRDAWLPGNTWAELRSEHEIPARADIYVGVDVGISHDATAVCWAHLLEDGRIALRTHVWCAAPDAAAHEHVPDGKVRLEKVEQFIIDLNRDYRVRAVAYDPRYFDRSAELLERAGLTMIEYLQASAPMGDAYQSFYQLAVEGKLTHDGDPIFAAHIDATAAYKTARGWKINKLKSSQRIDATVAAVLAVARAQHHNHHGPPQIFWLEA